MNKIKKLLLLPVMLGVMALWAGCDGDAEDAGEKIDRQLEKAGDKIEKGAEKTKDAVKDAADKVEDKVD